MIYTPKPRVFTFSYCCAATIAFSIPSTGRALANRRVGLRNPLPLGSCTGRGLIRFLGATAQGHHHYVSSTQLHRFTANRVRHLQQRQFFLNIYPEFLAILFLMPSILDLCMLFSMFIMIYFIRNLILHLPISSTC
jgi:hypothetical protein